MTQWANFFISAASASAALAGLIFVALSVNIARIVKMPHLPARAAATIGSLILILICSMSTLIPQPLSSLGMEILIFATCGWFMKSWSAYRALADRKYTHRPAYEAIVELVLGQIQMLPFLVGGALLWVAAPAGVYWISAGVIAVFVFSVFNGWVLLVEILR